MERENCACTPVSGQPPTGAAQPAGAGAGALESSFDIPKMDCSAEEALVRIALHGVDGIGSLRFDLPNRKLVVSHTTPAESIQARLEALGLGARLVSTSEASATTMPQNDRAESKTLWTLLAINAAMFVAELTAGLWAQSTGLIADSLDMFADAAVYGVSLYAVGRATALKRRAVHLSGWIQLSLAVFALLEVARRFVFGSEPDSPLMIVVAAIALVANVTCLVLISRHRRAGAHMRASWIFSSNDVLANIGVIAAGFLVAWTHSAIPDLLIGSIIAVVVFSGGLRILRLQ